MSFGISNFDAYTRGLSRGCGKRTGRVSAAAQGGGSHARDATRCNAGDRGGQVGSMTARSLDTVDDRVHNPVDESLGYADTGLTAIQQTAEARTVVLVSADID